MTKTALDITTEGLRWSGALDTVEAATADMAVAGRSVLQGLIDEFTSTHGATITWDVNTVPDGLFLPLSRLVAHDLAHRFNGEVMETRARAIGRVRAYLFPNDLPLRGDYDGDGTVDEDEAAASKRASFY